MSEIDYGRPSSSLNLDDVQTSDHGPVHGLLAHEPGVPVHMTALGPLDALLAHELGGSADVVALGPLDVLRKAHVPRNARQHVHGVQTGLLR